MPPLTTYTPSHFTRPHNSHALTHSPGSVPVDRKQLTAWEVGRQGRAYDYKRRYCGHCNTHTDIKEASFIGDGSGFVAAGSDDGNIFMYVDILLKWLCAAIMHDYQVHNTMQCELCGGRGGGGGGFAYLYVKL